MKESDSTCFKDFGLLEDLAKSRLRQLHLHAYIFRVFVCNYSPSHSIVTMSYYFYEKYVQPAICHPEHA